MMAVSSTSSEHRGAAAAADNKRTLAARRFTGRYVSLKSFKREGTGAATPVWFVVDDGKILVVADNRSYKVRRILPEPGRYRG
jgi:PPOX class probable F420-dependent enzyme